MFQHKYSTVSRFEHLLNNMTMALSNIFWKRKKYYSLLAEIPIFNLKRIVYATDYNETKTNKCLLSFG